MRAWLRASGENVGVRGAIPARLREKYWAAHPGARPAGAVTLLPGPDATDDDITAWEDMGDITPDAPESAMESIASGRTGEPASEGPEEGGEPLSVDPGPAHGRKDWRRPSGKAAPGRGAARPGRVTAAVRGDITAKISFALEIPGRVWQARDPACGGTFIEQRPAIADALTDIVCQSPDLIAWFAGSGGQFMLWLNLAAACWPVATVVMAHHVYHTLEEAPADAQQPDYGQYAA